MSVGQPSLKAHTAVLVTAIVLYNLIGTGWAKSCYICNSTLDHNCQEKFDHSSRVAQQKKGECDLWDAKFCVKVTGLWGGVVGTHRFCSSRDLGYQCQDIWYPDHDRMYRACSYTCSADDCNKATRMSVTAVSIVLVGWALHQLQQLVLH